MKSVFVKVAKWFGVGLLALFVIGVVLEFVDPEGMKKAREDNAKATSERDAKKESDGKKSDQKTDRIFTHGFTAGYSMAKGGAIKPSSDQVDAMARRAAADLGESGGMGFKMAWKNAFWAGWRKGD